MNSLRSKIDNFYGVGFRDILLFRTNLNRIRQNLSAGLIFRMRIIGASAVGMSILACVFNEAGVVIHLLVMGYFSVVLSNLLYPELMRVHKIRVAVKREGFSGFESKEISDLIDGSLLINDKQEKIRKIVALFLPLIAFFLSLLIGLGFE